MMLNPDPVGPVGQKRSCFRTASAWLRRERDAGRNITGFLVSLPSLLFLRSVGVPFSLWFVNVLVQRVFRVNASVPFQVNFTTKVEFPERLRGGRNVGRSLAISGGCYGQAGNGVSIGDGTIFAPGVKIISANHEKSAGRGWIEGDGVRIGARCWIGANAIILPGVCLGDDVIVGAGAVVTKSFPTGSTVVGNPARLIGRGSGETTSK